jgi:hypothetical protein
LSFYDLRKLGFAPGPLYREILAALRFARLSAGNVKKCVFFPENELISFP